MASKDSETTEKKTAKTGGKGAKPFGQQGPNAPKDADANLNEGQRMQLEDAGKMTTTNVSGDEGGQTDELRSNFIGEGELGKKAAESGAGASHDTANFYGRHVQNR